MSRKIVGNMGVIFIGVGFILMAMNNVLESEYASGLQAVLGLIFIVAGIKRILS